METGVFLYVNGYSDDALLCGFTPCETTARVLVCFDSPSDYQPTLSSISPKSTDKFSRSSSSRKFVQSGPQFDVHCSTTDDMVQNHFEGTYKSSLHAVEHSLGEAGDEIPGNLDKIASKF